MSDHEGEGLDLERWEEASLPGASHFSYAASEVFIQGTTQPNANFHPPTGPRGGPKGRFPAQRQNGFPPPRQNGFSPAPARVLQQQARFGQPRDGPLQSKQQVLKPPVWRNEAQTQAEKGEPPNGQYKFKSERKWKELSRMSLNVNRAAQPPPKQLLKIIMGRTNTFIREPEPEDETLFIWGGENEVVEAKAQVAEWDQDVQQSHANTREEFWYKGRALDGRAANRQDRQAQQNIMKELIQEAAIDYPVEAAFLWPRELDIEEFEKANKEVLDQLRGKYKCQINFPSANTQHIMLAAHSEADAVTLMTRTMNLIKEMISRRDQLVTVNMVDLPNFNLYRDRVGLLDLDPKTQSYLPTLHGKPAEKEEVLNNDRRQIHSGNWKKIKKTVDVAVKKLRMSSQHCRMRFVFGELGFLLFMKPTGGAETYTFEDFYTMVTKGRTQLRLNGLPVRQGDITLLADILDENEAFSDCSEYYAAFFDFPGTSHNTTLRLETVFTPMGVDETENREKRWVELNDMVSRLQVSHLNFDRPDYQITLDAFPVTTEKPPKLRNQMNAFQANVTMDRPPIGIKSFPRRRTHHRPENGLQYVSEMIMLKWRFKNTDGVFELRRKDTYDLRPGRESGTPVETRWHALYYYPEWDNLMGEFASIKPGEDVQWVKSVATFFPEAADEWSALPRGFKNFMNEVEEIQDLLAEAIGRLAKGKGKERAE
ncbi:hypothetical protein H2200_002965 [Cladophialophora chaetospira]|uniref:DUF7905 domain-containing protein n=1 Tax=Cladophialophora chaetospira TaxID=386627 RepID=A0AA39CL16_9EURO|nr:hypothetical protein H2200_002965 [Cladophialophora chaetospira]